MTSLPELEEARKKVLELFERNVLGRIPDVSKYDQGHDGKVGNWLEEQLGVKPNASNAPDLNGIEVKTSTKSVISLGSWDPNYWIFRDNKYGLTRDSFMAVFGKLNPKKNLYSWSGSPVPKINGTNDFGVRIDINEDNNISFVYSYDDDKRVDKSSIIPKHLQVNNLTLARWDADYYKNRSNASKKGLRQKVEEKYNTNGWCKCYRNKVNGELREYTAIGFGDPMTFATFMGYYKDENFYFDSGMHQSKKSKKKNLRNYCQWRTKNKFIDTLVVSRHPPQV